MGRLSLNITDNYPDVSWHNINNLKNIIAYDYESIRLDMIRDALTKFLPEFKQKLLMIINWEIKLTRFEYEDKEYGCYIES